MNPAKASFTKRSWKTTKDGKPITCTTWRVRWQGVWRGGERRRCEKSGFTKRVLAEAYLQDQVIPALEAGFDTPEQLAAAQVAASAESSRTVAEWFVEFTGSELDYLSKHYSGDHVSVLTRAMNLWGGSRQLRDITKDDVRNFVMGNTPKGAPSNDTCRARTIIVRKFFDAARSRGFIENSPTDGMKLPKSGKGVDKFLSMDETQRLMKACGEYVSRDDGSASAEYLRAFVATALYTGSRRSELFHLEWSDFQDKPEGGVQVSIQPKPHFNWTTKNKKARHLSVNPDLRTYLDAYRAERSQRLEAARKKLGRLRKWSETPAALRKIQDKPAELLRFEKAPSISTLVSRAEGLVGSLELQEASTLVFPNPWGKPATEVPKGFDQAVKAAGLKDVTLHVLRHTYASHLAMRGVDIPTIQQLLSHSSITTTMRYAHLSPEHVGAAGLRMPTIPNATGALVGQRITGEIPAVQAKVADA